MWQPSVLETYGNQTTSYINAISGPMRRNFPNYVGERELITSLTKVLINLLHRWIYYDFQNVTYYNAYEKDIAIVNIFFGEPTVYGESLCHCLYLCNYSQSTRGCRR